MGCYDGDVSEKSTILVLDDDPSLRHMLQVLLEQDGHSVITAGDVRSALAQCKVQVPDLMVVDLMLPIEDGEMFLREFRRRWRHESVPVIVLSASSARNDIARRLGVEATLAKPFFAEDLRELVRRFAKKRESVATG
jgi:DNA-binding response OmpR family regulator